MIIGITGRAQSGKNTIGNIIQYLVDYQSAQYTHPINEKDFNSYMRNNHYLKSDWKIKKFANKLKDIVCILIGCTRIQLEDNIFKETALGEEWIKYEVFYSDKYNTYSNYFNTISEATEFIKENESNYFRIQIPKLIQLTPRKLLQLISTECGKEIIHPNIWINSLMADYQNDIYFSLYNLVDNKNSIQTNIKASLTEYPYWIITDVKFPNEVKSIKEKNGIIIKINRPIMIRRYSNAASYIDKPFDKNNKKHVKLLEGELLRNPPQESKIALDNCESDYVIENEGTLDDLIKKVKEILIKEGILNK